MVEFKSFTVKLPVWAAPTVVPLKLRPEVAPLVAPGATLTGPATEPAVFVPAAALKARLAEPVGAEFATVKLKAVLPPVMIEAAAGVARIVLMVALCCASSSLAVKVP